MNQMEKKNVKIRGLALVFFFIILFIIVTLKSLPSKQNHRKDANLQIDNTGRVFLRLTDFPTAPIAPSMQQEISQFLFAPIDINTASLEKLTTAQGVGEKIAARICALRTKRSLTSAEDLLQIKGIGAKKAKKLEKHFIFIEKENHSQ